VLAILGEAFLVFGFVLLAEASKGDSLLIRDVVAALPGSPWRTATIVMLVAGFGIKAGLAPLHVWLPLAHPAAPMPASAVLSGAIVKAGVIGLIRFLPADAGLSMSTWGTALAVIGVFTAYYAVLVGLTQDNPKTVLAYSTASQMGVVTAVIGMALTWAQNDGGVAVAFYAAHHALAKGAMFLAVGVFASCGTRWRVPVLVATGAVALGLAGLPLSGGALAKLAIKAPLGDGVIAALTTLSAAGTAALMLHFLHRLHSSLAPKSDAALAAGLVLPWLCLAIGAFALPWLFFSGMIAPDPDMVSPYALWSAAWPILLGVVVWAAFATFGQRLRRVPEGDIVVYGEALAQRSGAWAETIERWDAVMRRWPVAGLSLLSLVVILCMTMAAVR
jgi:formate hydrogenlyase subunit 3/multisubunit Na+/H+ antiporter MnhD subunit